MLVDSHCHLDFPDFADELDDVVARAGNAGVGRMLTICTHITKADQVQAVAERFEHIDCTVGIHPHEAGREPETDADRLVAMAGHPKVVGLGETGLDFYYEHSPRADQERSFRSHIAAARETGLPVVIHTRDADDDTIRILEEETETQGPFPGLIHCFSSGPELAAVALRLGLKISISGIVTFKKATALRDTVRQIPIESLLVETDAPYLAPVPYRGKRNEPAYVAHTAACVAELLGVTPEDLAEQTTANYLALFTKIRT